MPSNPFEDSPSPAEIGHTNAGIINVLRTVERQLSIRFDALERKMEDISRSNNGADMKLTRIETQVEELRKTVHEHNDEVRGLRDRITKIESDKATAASVSEIKTDVSTLKGQLLIYVAIGGAIMAALGQVIVHFINK